MERWNLLFFFFKRAVSESPETVRNEKWRNGNVVFCFGFVEGIMSLC